MGDKARRMDFYGDDWLAGTITLDPAERGVYITAIAAMVSHGAPIKTDELRRLCQCDLRVYKRALQRLVLLGKLTEKNGYLSNKRCLSEVQLARKRVLSAAQNARKRWPKNRKNNKLSDATLMLPSPSPSPSPSPEEVSKTLSIESGARATDQREDRYAKRAKRRSRIADDWQPDERDRQYAAERGRDWQWIEEQAGLFRDRNLATGTQYADWHAAWRTWVGRADDFRRGDRRSGRNGSSDSQILAALSRVNFASDLEQ